MTLEPAVILWFVGVEVVEDDVDGRVGMSGDDIVHEVEELDAPSALLVSGHHFAGGHLEGSKQRRGPVAPQAVLRFGRARQAFKFGAFLRRQTDRYGFRDAAHAFLNQDLFISDSGYQGGFR